MDELVKAYIDFMNWYDPYWEAYEEPENVIEVELPEMLYNLQEIRKEIEELNEPCNDWSQTLNRLNHVIGQFTTAGIRSIET